MSIASRTTSIIGHIEDDYNALERLGADLTNVDKNIENITSVVNNIYDKLPKVTGTGSNLSLTPTLKGGLNILPLGNAEQDTYTGKNKFNINALTGNMQNVTFGNDKLILTGSSDYHGTNVGTNLKDIANLEVGQNYILSFDTTYTGTNANRIFVRGSQTYWEKGDTLTITQEMLDDRIAFYGTNNAEISNIMIRLASVSDTSYEPYVGGIPSPNPSYPQDVKVVTGDNQVVVQNKNIYDYKNCVAGVNTTINSYNANNIEITYVGTYKAVSQHFKLINNEKYTISVGNISNSTARIELRFFKNNVAVTSLNYNLTANNNYTFTANTSVADTLIINLSNGNLNGTNTITFSDIQLEYGEVKTTYIQGKSQSFTLHLGDIKLNGIGNYIDLPFKDGDTWKIRRKVGKVVLNGSESWAFNSQLQNIKNFTTVINSLPSITNSDNVIRVVSNKLIGKSASVIINQASTYSIGIISNKRIFVTTDTTFTTSADDFKTWLQSNNIIVYYELAEPTEETITDTTLINELNELQDLLSYDGTTNITITSDSSNAQMIVQVTALKGE